MRQKIRIIFGFLCLLLLILRPAEIAAQEYAQEMGQEDKALWTDEDKQRNGETFYLEDYCINPLYEEQAVSLAQMQSEEEIPHSEQIESRVFSCKEDVAAYMNEKLIGREYMITYTYLTAADKNHIKEELREIWQMALAWNEDQNLKSGDYLRFQFGSYRMAASCEKEDEGYCYKISYTVTYYTDLAKENEMDERVPEILQQLEIAQKDPYQKIVAIYEYICQNVAYDYTNLNDSSYTRKFTAYAALVDRTAVCQGYALLFYRMCREAGINARVIAGQGSGAEHAWNIVELDRLYYNVDATWDSADASSHYFLKSDMDFTGHLRDVEYSAEEFYAKYPMAETSYKRNETDRLDPPSRPEIRQITAGAHANSLKISWSSVDGADGYELYGRKAGDLYFEKAAVLENWREIEYEAGKLSGGVNYYYKIRAFVRNRDGGRIYGEYSGIKGGHVSLAPPSFEVTGCFDGKEVTFRSASENTIIYYSKNGSALTVQDTSVENGNTVKFGAYYGSIYAKAYDPATGAWSPVARLILKIPPVNNPTATRQEDNIRIDCTTPGAYLIYTVDGTEPSLNNGTWVWSNHIEIEAEKEKSLKVIAIRSCFGNSDIVAILPAL